MARVTAELTSGLVTKLSNGRHTWYADEPVEAKGTDVGPNPFELLLAALAACTCITLQLYCSHKNIKLKSVSAQYEHSRIDAADCDGCQQEEGKVDHITGRVRIAGEFSDKQRQRLEEIAQRCPVHRALGSEIHMSDEVEFAS